MVVNSSQITRKAGNLIEKSSFWGANSLDNYFAREEGAVDWLIWSDEAAQIMNDFWPRFDTIIMGRKTYEQAMKNAPPDASDVYNGMMTYVFSRTLPSEKKPGLEITDQDPAEFLRSLKSQDGKDICVMGGGDLARTLFEAGVIDEIGFNIHPVLLGSGIPLFYKMNRQIDLELIDCRRLKSGCVYVLYKVKN